MPARRWRSSRQSAAPSCSGAIATRHRSERRAPARCARPRAERSSSGQRTSKAAQAALRRADPASTTTRSTRSSDALFEAQDEEEQLSYEWTIEREIDEMPRKALLMPWTRSGEDDKRFRKSARARAAVRDAVQRDRFADRPAAADRRRRRAVPQRVVRLLMEERPKPPAPTRESEPKPKVQKLAKKPVEKPVQAREGRAEGRGAGAEGAGSERTRAFSRSASKLAARQGRSGRRRRSARRRASTTPTTTRRPRAALDADDERAGLERRHQSRVAQPRHGRRQRQGRRHGRRAGRRARRSAIAAVGTPGGDRPLSGDGAAAGRTDEEIQIVFDRYKSALYRLYNKELRKRSDAAGPDGAAAHDRAGRQRVVVRAASRRDMNAPEL